MFTSFDTCSEKVNPESMTTPRVRTLVDSGMAQPDTTTVGSRRFFSLFDDPSHRTSVLYCTTRMTQEMLWKKTIHPATLQGQIKDS